MEEVLISKPTEAQVKEASTWPIWTKEISAFDMNYSNTERCLILEGEVRVEVGNKKFYFKGGDYVVFPKGLKCRWIILKPVRKHYNFESD